jgi:WD40 repeat protein
VERHGVAVRAVVDVDSGRDVTRPAEEVSGPISASMSPDGRTVALGGLGGATIWDVGTGASRYPLPGHPWVDSFAWAPDSRALATGGDQIGDVEVWEFGDAGRLLLTVSALELRGGVDGLAFSPDGTRLVAGAADGRALKVWDVSATGDAEVLNVPTIDAFGSIGFSADGRLVAADRRGRVRLWDLGTGIGGRPIGSVLDTEHSFAVRPDGTMVAYHDGTVWDLRTGAHVMTLPEGGGLDGIDWAPAGDALAVLSPFGTEVYDLEGRTLARLPAQRDLGVVMARFSPDGRLIATIDGDDESGRSQIVLWDWEHERVVRTVMTDVAQAVTFDPSGTRLLTSFGPGVLWDVATGSRLGVLDGYPNEIGLAAFSPDGSWIAAGQDDTVRIFDARSGKQTLLLRAGTQHTIARVAFSADGHMLASQAPGDAARVWALDIDDLLAAARRHVTRGFTDEECDRFLHGPCGHR